ncbi:MAG: hypothetical protein V4760_08780 [Bdellovibrionota bacterium]
MTHTLRAFKVVLRLHPYLVVLLFAVLIAAVVGLRSAFIQDPFVREPGSLDDSSTTIHHFVMAFGYSFFVLFLGVMFNVQARSSWLFHLPISERAFLFVPLASIGIYGAILCYLVPLGDFTAGANMVFFGAPILGFLVVKNASSILTGVFKSAAFAILLFFLWTTLFLRWSSRQELYQADLFYVGVFAVLCLLFEKRQRLLVLLPAAVLFAAIVVKLASIQSKPAENFLEAVRDLGYLETPKTRSEFKRLALDPSAWQSVELFAFSRFTKGRAKGHAVDLFDPSEQVIYFKNAETSYRTWKPRVVNERWILQRGVFPQPYVGYGDFNAPIPAEYIKEPLFSYLYENWKDEPAFCASIPFETTPRFATKVFESECGPHRFYDREFWLAYLFGSSPEFERTADEYLLSSNQKVSTAVRRSRDFAFFYGWGYSYDDRQSLSEPYLKGTMTAEKLAETKTKIRDRVKDMLAPLNGPRDVFVNEVNRQVSFYVDDEETGAFLICQLVPACANPPDDESGERRTLLRHISNWLVNPLDIGLVARNRELRKNLLDEKNWPAIQAELERISRL